MNIFKNLLILIFFTLFVSCHENIEGEKIETINLDIKNKKLNKFFFGSKFHFNKGLKYSDSLAQYYLKGKKSSIIFKVPNRFISGFQEGYLMDNQLVFYLHDLTRISSHPINLRFNKYKPLKRFEFLPKFNKNNLELLKNRSSKIYSLNDDLSLKPIFLSDEFQNNSNKKLNQLVFHESTRKNFEVLEKLKIYPIDFGSFIFIHNPLTGLYTCLPNFERFDTIKNEVLNNLKKKLNYEIQQNRTIKDSIILNGHMSFEHSISYSNKTVIVKKGSRLKLKNDSNLYFYF